MAAMELPPRRSQKQEITIQRNRSSLEILMQMGFPKHRAEKSLAATGDKGVQLASDWLLSHVNDPTLDDHTQRDYILYLCPVGQMQQELLEFWQKTYQECGWNRAHNYFPHITLCSFFKAEDAVVSVMSHLLKKVAEEKAKTMPNVMQMEYFSSANFIGLFVSESIAALLKDLTAEFAEEIKKAGVSVKQHKKQLHMSLAYQFPTEKKDKLESLAKTIDLSLPVRWDVRLYSRDSRIANCQVWKVLHTHNPRASDELELIEEDFICLKEGDCVDTQDGWYKGTSWLTGVTGMVPGSYTERTAESETWTMHRSVPVIGTDVQVHSAKLEQNGPSQVDNTLYTQLQLYRTRRRRAPGSTSPKSSRRIAKNQGSIIGGGAVGGAGGVTLDSPTIERRPDQDLRPQQLSQQQQQPPHMSNMSKTSKDSSIANKSSRQHPSAASDAALRSSQTQTHTMQTSNHQNSHERTSPCHKGPDGRTSPKPTRRNIPASTPIANKGPRQLYVVRHGERVDFTFGKDWIQNSFDQSGNYIRYDLNMPKALPKRKGGPQDFSKDSPLTVQGHFQAGLVGEALAEKCIPISIVYASPSLRCVETAASILEGLETECEIHIEPGLFEWLGWYQSGVPRFMSPEELREFGFNVGLSHIPVWPVSKYNIQETTEQYYERCYKVTKEILKKHEHEGGNVLLVAHAASLDVCTRQLVGQPPRSHTGFHDILHKIPYCAMSVAQEACLVKDTWYLIEPPILPFAHTNNPKYNWTCLTTPSLI